MHPAPCRSPIIPFSTIMSVAICSLHPFAYRQLFIFPQQKEGMTRRIMMMALKHRHYYGQHHQHHCHCLPYPFHFHKYSTFSLRHQAINIFSPIPTKHN
ncbi:MAG: hypothetical protein PUD39_04035 [Bacteroidales bacterium]|nr:hypothetical protein [Bacteroidales bacterium]